MNYLSNLDKFKKEFYQFGLLPEDEAICIAEKAIIDGNNNASIIYPKNAWGKRIVTISTTETGLLGFATASTTDLAKSYLAGQFDEDDVRYIRITNLDSTNHITLTFRDEDSTEFCIKVDAGHSFIYPGDNSGGVVDTMHAGGSALTVSFNDLVDITATADTDSCDVEVFVGSA